MGILNDLDLILHRQRLNGIIRIADMMTIIWRTPTTLTLTLVLLLLQFTGFSNGCIAKMKKEESHNLWDSMTFKRTIDPMLCECGKFNPHNNDTFPWNVFVHAKNRRLPSLKTCSGTIVNSNTIVTSHKCLLFQKKMRIADIIKFKHGDNSIARPEDVTVTSKKHINGVDTKFFEVTDIWYNPNFASTSLNSDYPEDDMVLIKVKADFTSTKEFTPICVPFYEEIEDEKFKIARKGFYYNFLEDADNDIPVFYDALNVTVNVTTPEVKGFQLEDGVIKKKSDFHKGEPKSTDKSFHKTLGVKFQEDQKEKTEGGPLVTQVNRGDVTIGYLVGISSYYGDASLITGRDASLGMNYAYFSWINPMVKFLEHYSQLKGQESKWCVTQQLKLNAPADGADDLEDDDDNDDEDDEKLPWEDMKPVVRDESLDCLCGVQNTKIMGRVVGGVEATPREFGWMTLLQLYPFGKKSGASLCGGAVINDRMILTAAHCVVVEKWLSNPKVAIDPENVVVTLNAHLRSGDPNGIKKEVSSVLFHPKYVEARLDGYFDFDLALLVLKEPIEFAKGRAGIRPICLSKMGEYMEVVGRNAWVVGWGLTDPNDRHSAADKLQKIELPVAELSFCANVASHVTDNFLCAGTLNMYKDAAAGDSGGPLQIEDRENSQWYEVGAVSYGEDVSIDGEVLTAALYADLQKLMPFIDFHARRVNAKWCKPRPKEEEETEESSGESDSKVVAVERK